MPVVFWIHGGGWQGGDRTSVQLKPTAFVEKGFVFVSTGYRLLPHVEMVEIFHDVAKSLHWVHHHIIPSSMKTSDGLTLGQQLRCSSLSPIPYESNLDHAEAEAWRSLPGKFRLNPNWMWSPPAAAA